MSARTVYVSGVSKRFGNTVAVNDVTLEIASGEFFSLLGPSGCGKTTLLRMIAGFEEPTEGRIVVAGRDMAGVPPHKRPVNMVFQSYALFPHLTVFDNIAFGLRATGCVKREEIAERVNWALNLVRLEGFGDRYPRQVSGGQGQRVALARAVVNRTSVLLLDEPLSALDLKIRQEMQEELYRLQRELGITFVMVTHDQGEALALSDRMAVFCQGNLEQLGTPEEIYEQPRTRFVAEFIGQTNVLDGVLVDLGNCFSLVQLSSGQSIWVKKRSDQDPSFAGQAVAVWIRTQSFQLSAEPVPALEEVLAGEPINRFQATVVSRSFQGMHTAYRIVIGADLHIQVSCPKNADCSFSAGQAVTVLLPASQASFLTGTAGGVIDSDHCDAPLASTG